KDESDKILTDHLVLHFIELPKVKSNMGKNSLEIWSQYFINEGVDNNIMKTLLKDEPMIVKAHDEFKKFTADERLRDIYESRLKAQRDHAYFMEIAREEGLEKGMKEGIEKGIEKVAITLLDDFDDETIAQKTGLTRDHVRTLRVQNK
ncbi:MAG TPA: Rpn family recombination-promoting nuclease/putative transposase, partial [Spirochaetota bacterium]|nr:Rpn family recombination-promoting nuclease/putative transposase [Spirochaetota bacterium]